VGDCAEVRNIKEAMKEGYFAALAI
jgi:hypothetical protein